MDPRFGRPSWFELPATDAVDTMGFYEGLFGWAFMKMKEPALDGYWIIKQGQDLIGGLRESKTPPGGAGPVLYFTVETLDPAVQRARDLGARLDGPAVDLGDGRGRYQWLRDRQGNLVALWASR